MKINGYPVVKLAALLWTLGMILLASDSVGGNPELFPGQDKVLHAGAFALLAGLYGLGWPGATGMPRRWLPACGCFVFGLLIEIGQQLLTRTRSAELLDLAADLVGIAVAVVLMPRLFSPRVKENPA